MDRWNMGRMKDLDLMNKHVASLANISEPIRFTSPINIRELEQRFVERLALAGIKVIDQPSSNAIGETFVIISSVELQAALSEVANDAKWSNK
jgi:hypothetical protein